MQTVIGLNSAQARKIWGLATATAVSKASYFDQRFVGKGSNNVIERKVDLEGADGDEILFDLRMPLRGEMTYGDDIVEGKEEALKFHQDRVKIDQARKGASGGGKMSRKRTIHDMRQQARDATAEYVAEWLDEGFFVYLSGDSTFSAINPDRKHKGPFADNPVTAPDPAHMMYGGAATSKATLTDADKMSVALIERAAVKPKMIATLDPESARMVPVSVEGEKRFVMLMSPYQGHALRTETGDLSWSKIQQALATSIGKNSPICKGGFGMINNTVLHEHENVRLFNDYGAGQNVAAARALLLGRQAGVVAYGASGGGSRFSWVEQMTDAENRVSIYAGVILGMKKTTFNGRDFGVIAVDTAATNPG